MRERERDNSIITIKLLQSMQHMVPLLLYSALALTTPYVEAHAHLGSQNVRTYILPSSPTGENMNNN
jgi:hypothetical protein